jgi:hypothetical protein
MEFETFLICFRIRPIFEQNRSIYVTASENRFIIVDWGVNFSNFHGCFPRMKFGYFRGSHLFLRACRAESINLLLVEIGQMLKKLL